MNSNQLTIQPNQRPPKACSHLSSGSHASWRFIPLTQNKFAIVDDFNYEWLNQWKWYVNNRGYAFRQIKRGNNTKTIMMHRLIVDAKIGQLSDHINHNGLDNRNENLRICDRFQNQHNRKPNKNTSSKYKGVSFDKKRKKWYVKIECKGKRYRLGRFDCEIEAAKAYDAKARELHGEFAYLNLVLLNLRLGFLIIVLLAGCASQPTPRYVSPYGSPFGPKITQEQLEEIRFCAMWELWAQTQLRLY